MADNDAQPLLRVEGLVAGYDAKQILNGVSLVVSASEIVVVLGHNGAGKSTLLKVIFKLIDPWAGRIWVDQRDVMGLAPRDLLALGVSFVPQGGRVFNDLTVREHFRIAGLGIDRASSLEERIGRVLEIFPVLRPLLGRRAAGLSGGERQMVAIGSGLIPAPRLLLLDEPSLGLTPGLTSRIFGKIEEIASENVGVLLVEQRVREALVHAHRAYVLRDGAVTFSGAAALLMNEMDLRNAYF